MNNTQLFRRKKNFYYAFLEEVEYIEGTYILKFDAVDQVDMDLVAEISRDSQVSKLDIFQKIDAFSIHVEINKEHILFESIKENIDKNYIVNNQWYILKGEHSKEGEASFFQDYMEKQDTISEYKISSLKKVEEQKRKFLEKLCSENDLEYQESTKFKSDMQDFFVSIYSVGQGLCSAICNLKSQPLLYFDFGGGEGRNRATYPKNIKFCFKKNPKIILSHIHRDHWIGVSHFKEALNTEWVVPIQKHGPQFTKLLCDVSKNGILTIVKYNDRIINTPYGEIFIANGKFSHPHNNGLGFLVKTKENKRYLMPGDNRYQYIPSRYLININGLVASHHGGEYYGNKTGKGIIPYNNMNGSIVYSYGNNNTYGHPSYNNEYLKNGWESEMHTLSNHCHFNRPLKFTKCSCGCNI